VTAVDVQLMQDLAQHVTAMRPDPVNSDASFGELAWNWGKGHASEGASRRRRLWFSGGDPVAWSWAHLPHQVRRSDGPAKPRPVLLRLDVTFSCKFVCDTRWAVRTALPSSRSGTSWISTRTGSPAWAGSRRRQPVPSAAMQPIPVLPEHAHNVALLAYLGAQACPPSGPDDMALGEWQLHTHPDLEDRLAELAPRTGLLHSAYGVPVLAEAGIAAVVAIGMDTLLLRLDSAPGNLTASRPVSTLTDQGWHAVDAWQSDLITAEGDRRLTGAVRGALAAARALAN
jgi:hypothetical protein